MMTKMNSQNQDTSLIHSGKFDSVFDAKPPRRKFLKYMMLGGIGLTGGILAEMLQNQPAIAQVNRQDNWQWCNKCQALTFAGTDSLGACPAGGVHNHQGSSNYVLILNSPGVQGQGNWRWCNKCQSLTYAGTDSLGQCAAGGTHDHGGSGNYVLRENDPNYSGQDNWRWCNKCQTLSYAGADSLGACPAGGVHNHSGSGNYTLQGT